MSSPAAAPSAMSSTIPEDFEAYLFDLYEEHKDRGGSPDEAANSMKRLHKARAKYKWAEYNGKEWWAHWRFVTDALIAHFEHEVRLKSLYRES
jgi:hypothetical protein